MGPCRCCALHTRVPAPGAMPTALGMEGRDAQPIPSTWGPQTHLGMNTAAAKGLHASFPPLMVARSQPRSSAPFPALTLSSELRGHPPQTPATTLAVSQRLPRVLPRDPAPRRALGRLCRAIHLQTRAQANGTNAAPSPQPAAGAEQKGSGQMALTIPGSPCSALCTPSFPLPPTTHSFPSHGLFDPFPLEKARAITGASHAAQV